MRCKGTDFCGIGKPFLRFFLPVCAFLCRTGRLRHGLITLRHHGINPERASRRTTKLPPPNRSLDRHKATSENNASPSASAPLSSSCLPPGLGVAGYAKAHAAGNLPDNNRTKPDWLSNDRLGLKPGAKKVPQDFRKSGNTFVEKRCRFFLRVPELVYHSCRRL